MTRAIGIEVGARRCLAAETHDGEAAVIEVDGAPCSLPSVVCLAPDGALVVGERARRLGLMRPRYGLADLPRHLESRLEALSSGRPACVTLAGARGELRVRLDGLTDVYVDRSKKAGASDDDSDEVAIAGGGSVRAAGDGRDEAGADDDALDEASAGADDDALDDVEATGEVADDASAGEAAGEANDGEATGVAAGEASAGEATGEAAGEARGEATGVVAGEASGEATGEATGEASGEATGEASDGEATGEAAGEASGADDDDIDIDADVDDDAEVLADAAGDAGSSDPASRGQDGVHTVPGLLGLVLTELRRRAERGAPGSWGPVILTTPAALGVVGRVALRDACDLAGLSVARFILRTTAIGLEHRARRVARGEVFEGPTPVLVIDHGHGSFEVAVVDLDDAGLEVKAVEGLGELGGWAFCERVVEWLRERFTDGEATAFDATIRERMLDAASKAVARLSEAEEVELHLPFLSADESGPRHLRETLTQARFTSLVEDLTRRCVDAMRRVLDRAGVRPEQLDAIVMAGGCSHLPCLQEQVETLCKREPLLELDDAACARGAARLAAGLGDADDDDDERSLRVRERVTHPLWIGDAKGGVVELIPRGRPLPVRVEHRLTERRALYHEGVDASGALGQPLGFVAPGRSPTTAFLFDESHALSISSGRVTLPLEDAPGLSPVERAAAIEAARADEAAYVRARVSAERRERLERWLGRAEQLLADRRPPAEGDGEASPTDRVLAPLEEALAGVREALAEGDDARLEQSDAALAELLDALPGDIAGHIRREPSPVGRDRFPRVSTLEEEEPQEAEDDSAPESGKVGKRPPPRVA